MMQRNEYLWATNCAFICFVTCALNTVAFAYGNTLLPFLWGLGMGVFFVLDAIILMKTKVIE